MKDKKDERIRSIERAFRASAFNFVVYAVTSISFSISLVSIKNELGLNFTESASFSLVSSIEQAIILLLVPIFLSKYPKVRVLKTSLFVLMAGVICFALSYSYLSAMCSLLLMGCGTALQEALLTPIVADLYPDEVNEKMNVMHGFWPLGICASLFLVGYLLSHSVSWRCVYFGIAVMAFCNFWFYPHSKNVPFKDSKFDLASAAKIFSSPSFWFFGFALFFIGGAEGAFAFWSASFIQLNLKTSVFLAGVITSFFSFGMIVGRFGSSRLLRYLSVHTLIVASSFISISISFLFYFVNSVYGLAVFLFLIGMFMACLWPTVQSYASVILPFDATAIMVFLSCFGVPGYSTSSFVMGMIGDRLGLFAAFIIVVPFFLFFPPFLFLLACKAQRR